MEWAEYKRLCDRPDVWSRWMLEQTTELLVRFGRNELARSLDVAERKPLKKPDGHRGDETTDMFELALSRAEAEAIARIVAASVAVGERTAGTRSRGLGGFVEAWNEYLRWLER
jgi:hypothetical protein